VEKVCGRNHDGLWNENVYGRPVCRLGGPVSYHLYTCRLCTCLCLYPCLCLYLCLFLCPCLFLCRRRTSIWEAFDCAWLAMETAMNGETVLPSYVVSPVNTTCLALPFQETEEVMRGKERNSKTEAEERATAVTGLVLTFVCLGI
jgi:hypothetical protein